MPLHRFCGKARVIDVQAPEPPGEIDARVLDGIDGEPLDFILFQTGWERHWGTNRYYEAWPFLTLDLAQQLKAWGLKGVGIDCPSIDPPNGRFQRKKS